MRAFDPCHIVNDIPDRSEPRKAPSRRDQVIKGSEADQTRSAERRRPGLLQSKTGETCMEDVDKVLRERSIIACGKPLVVGEVRKSSRLTGELLRGVVLVVLQIAAPE